MTLHKTQVGALAATPQTRPIGGPVVVKHAAFQVSPASYDELTRLLRAREYHHVFDDSNGAIYLDNIALTRGKVSNDPFCSAILLENGKTGLDHRYMGLDDGGVPRPTTRADDAIRFARDTDAIAFAKLLAIFSAVCTPTTWEPVAHLWG